MRDIARLGSFQLVIGEEGHAGRSEERGRRRVRGEIKAGSKLETSARKIRGVGRQMMCAEG